MKRFNQYRIMWVFVFFDLLIIGGGFNAKYLGELVVHFDGAFTH